MGIQELWWTWLSLLNYDCDTENTYENTYEKVPTYIIGQEKQAIGHGIYEDTAMESTHENIVVARVAINCNIVN